MHESKIPLRVFFSHCLDAAEAAGYEIILCLVAREGDAPEIYAEVKRYWYSLHDLTGPSVLFVFAGPHQGDIAGGGVQDSKEPINYVASGMSVMPGNKLHFDAAGFSKPPLNSAALKMWEGLQHTASTIRKRSSRVDLPERHSLQVSDLKAVFNLRERDLPCLHVTFLRDRTSCALGIPKGGGFSFYSCLKAVVGETEAHFAKLHDLSTKMQPGGPTIETESILESVTALTLRNTSPMCSSGCPR